MTFEEAVLICLTFYIFGMALGYAWGFINGRRYEDRLRFMKRTRTTLNLARDVVNGRYPKRR